jgi:5-methylthioadenosine/S-adenosylhomocysteine deaminase
MSNATVPFFPIADKAPSVLFRGASVLTMDADDRLLTDTDVLVENRQISAVGVGLAAPDGTRIIDASQHLLMPGLINGHVHSPANFLKGALDDAPLEMFMLYEVPPLAGAPDSARMCNLRTLLGAAEMLKLGITSVHDDAFFNPVPTPEIIDAVMEAYAKSGMRANVSLDQPNVVEFDKYPFLKDLLPQDLRRHMENAPRQSDGELIALYRAFISKWHGAERGRLRASVSCSAPQRVTVPYFEALTELSAEHGLPFIIHILETRLQRVLGQEKYGKSLVRYVDDLGLLDERKLVIHAVWIDRHDIDLLAASGCTVAHNPISNLKLGSGVMPYRALRDAGVPICLGTDEAAVDDTANMWGVAKVAGLIHKIADPEWQRWPKANEVLSDLLLGGARGMGLPDRIGRIVPGYAADLILVDLDTIAFTPLNDIRRQLVFCENGSSVTLTMVDGRIVYEDGKLTTIDEKALRAEIRGLMAEHQASLAETRLQADRLAPYYREMYRKTLSRPVGMNRWVGSNEDDQKN